MISRLAMEVIQRLIWRLSQKSAAEPAAATRPIAIDIGVARENKTRIAGRPLGAMNPIIAGRYAELLTGLAGSQAAYDKGCERKMGRI